MAVIVAGPTVLDPRIWALYVPLPLLVTPPMNWSGSLDEKVTGSLNSGCPWASVTVAVAVVVERPSARMVDGFSIRLTPAGGPAAWFKVAELEAEPSLAVMVVDPTVVELVNVTVHVPLELVVHDWLVGDVGVPATVKETGSFARGWPWASSTVAVAAVCELPSATMFDGLNPKMTVSAVWFRDCEGLCPARLLSLAVIVVEPGVVELVNVAVQVPLGSVMQDAGLGVTGEPAVAKLTVSPPTPTPVASVTTTVAVV